MTKEQFELTFGRKTLLHVEKGCYRKLQKVFGDWVAEVQKIYPTITLKIASEVLVFDIVNYTINGTNRTLFSSMVGIYQNLLRQAVFNAIVNDFHSGKLQKTSIPVMDVEQEILKGVHNGE